MDGCACKIHFPCVYLCTFFPPFSLLSLLPPSPLENSSLVSQICRCSGGISRAHSHTPDWMPGEWALLFFLRGQNIWELITVTLLSHTPAAPLTGHHGGNTDKLIPNPQNTFTKDYQIPCAPLLSVKVGRERGEGEGKKKCWSTTALWSEHIQNSSSRVWRSTAVSAGG